MDSTSQASTGYKVFRIIRIVFIYLLAVFIIVAAILFAASKSPDKSLFGFRYYTILTPSMEPEYSVGEMVFVKIESADKIEVGDVITFNPSSDSDAYLTHRVVEKLTNYEGTGVTCFRTKGDANDSADSFLIDEKRVIGRVKFGIPMLGYIVRFVQLRWYFVIPIIILLIVFFKLLGIYLAPPKDEDEAPEDKAEESTGPESGSDAGEAENSKSEETPPEPESEDKEKSE